MKKILILLLVVAPFTYLGAQNQVSDAFDKAVYPVFKSNHFMGVIPIKDFALRYDASEHPEDYKILLDIHSGPEDSTKLNYHLVDIGRTYNLHVYNGVPAEKIKMVVIIHGGAVDSMLKNKYFKKKYNMANPNLDMIKELSDGGVTFYVCGQSMYLKGVTPDMLTPEATQVLSAKTTVTQFEKMGYSYMELR